MIGDRKITTKHFCLPAKSTIFQHWMKVDSVFADRNKYKTSYFGENLQKKQKKRGFVK